MRVGSIQNFRSSNLTFGNILPEEKPEFLNVKKQALDIIGQPDKSVFIYSSACLPQSAERNTGTGTLLTKQGEELLDVIKTYTTANIIQDLPSGQHVPKPRDGFYSPYSGSSFAPAQNLIEPEILMDKKLGQLINADELKAVVDANNAENKNIFANVENVVETDSPFDKMLRNAYERFTTGEAEEVKKLREEFSQYKTQNAEWLEPHGIYEALSKKYNTSVYMAWPEDLDKNLYNLDTDAALRQNRINAVLKENADDIEFYNFKKFMADKCLGLARDKAHEKGLSFGGDVPYTFSLSDIYSNPKAFIYEVYMGPLEFNFPALNFYEINNPESPSAKLLKQKVKLAAQRYDTLRMDMGWGYITPILSKKDGSYKEHKEMGSSVLQLIENTVKEVKGDKFNPKDIFYEAEADGKDFTAFSNNDEVIEPLRGRTKIYTSDYMKEGWGSRGAYEGKFKFKPDEYIYGAVNHDSTPLYELAKSDRKPRQVKVLAGALNISEDALKDSGEFIRAKNAEPLLAKNHFMFFTEFFGINRKFNFHAVNGNGFRVKMPANPEKAYFEALRDGRGFNIMDAFERLFIAKGYDKKHPELFEKIVKFKEKLYAITPEQLMQAEVNEVKETAAVSSEVVSENVQTTENAVKNSGSVSPKPAAEAAETVKDSVKKNKYAKPLLIAAGILALLFGAYKFFTRKPRPAD